ncbi:nitroreductase [Zoogloea sp.]|uniref:nitroreductase n=1 Tax=Zoogloea sp. TaxID=49181 RepID=UPI0025EF9302|nr:nitroreductase [Zoogloea sp.]MCK6375884.1 nitroreductase [Zoogloea sp.]MCK6396401.1 nitroreductase [Zoogloea sp.]
MSTPNLPTDAGRGGPDATAAFDALVHARKSTRAFLPTPVPRAVVEDILRLAARAPSGNNIQPWRVHVASGAVLGRLVDEVCTAFDVADGSHVPEYAYYPTAFFEPYLSRRRRIGSDLYGALGIAKGDKARMHAQMRRNFTFFGAPVALVVTIDRRLAQGSWLDCGMFIQNLLLAATAHDLATCAQAAWIDYHRIVGRLLDFDAQEQLVCAVALGHADPAAPENALETVRAPVGEFVRFHADPGHD